MMFRLLQPTSSLFCMLLLAASLNGVNGQECTPCEGGQVDETKSFDGVTCSDWFAVAGSAPADSSQCAFDRMVGVWFCGCPVPEGVEDTCTLCGDGSASFNGAKTFPDSTITCNDISTIAAIDGSATCNELRTMGDYCECPVTGDQCGICPDGEEPEYPDRVFLTTGETCQYLIDLLSAAPRSNCDAYEPNLMVDYAAYCGCPEKLAPKTCSLCPEGTQLADPDREIMYAPGSTCSDFETYAEYIDGPQLCDFMHEVISVECCEGLDPALEDNEIMGDCSFCADGSSVTRPDSEIVGLNMTCGELASREGTDCDSTFETELDLLLDMTVYCGCPNSVDTGVCDFCPPGEELLYPDKLVDQGVVANHATCGAYAAMAASTYDTTFCGAIQSVGDLNDCCGVPEVDNNSTVAANSTAVSEEDTCHLCENGDPIQYGERLFLGTNITCQAYYDEMRNVPAGPICDAIFSDFESTFDPQIYCGCPGKVSTESCSLCPEGTTIVDPSIFISQILTSCGQMSEIADATSNEEFCDSIERVGEYYCCYSPGDVRHLRNSAPDIVSTDSDAIKRPYHFAAIKAVDKVEKAITHLVENGIVSQEEILPEDESD